MRLLDRRTWTRFPRGAARVYTKVHDNAPTRYAMDSRIKNSLLADGCIIEGEVENCVLFRGVRVKKGAKVKNCVLMQNTIVEPGAQAGVCGHRQKREADHRPQAFRHRYLPDLCAQGPYRIKTPTRAGLTRSSLSQGRGPLSAPAPFPCATHLGRRKAYLNVLFLCQRGKPFAASGGLGDVAGSLPKALVKDGWTAGWCCRSTAI